MFEDAPLWVQVLVGLSILTAGGLLFILVAALFDGDGGGK